MLSVLSIVLIILAILLIVIGIFCIVGDGEGFGLIVIALVIGFFAWGSIDKDIDKNNAQKIANNYIEDMKQEGYLTKDIEVKIEQDLHDKHINAYIEGTGEYENKEGKKVYLRLHDFGFFSFDVYVTGDKK